MSYICQRPGEDGGWWRVVSGCLLPEQVHAEARRRVGQTVSLSLDYRRGRQLTAPTPLKINSPPTNNRQSTNSPKNSAPALTPTTGSK